jgi:type II secretory pathway pseudopilin PulG
MMMRRTSSHGRTDTRPTGYVLLEAIVVLVVCALIAAAFYPLAAQLAADIDRIERDLLLEPEAERDPSVDLFYLR